MQLSLIIPAFNETASVVHTATVLKAVLIDLRQLYDVEVVFVDDGSQDDTAPLLREAFNADDQVTIVSHGVNRGLGAAIRTGFENAKGDIIVTTDFDGSYDFRTIPILLKYMKPGVDIVTASPYHKDGKVEDVPPYRLVFSFGASLLYRILVDRKVCTWTALFRAYRRSVVENVKFDSNNFLAGTEILVKAIQQGYKVAEYPTVLSSRPFGQSSMRVAQVTWAHLKFQSTLVKKHVADFLFRKTPKQPVPAEQPPTT
jgi:dolichol-phosphate mannosyltransferase